LRITLVPLKQIDTSAPPKSTNKIVVLTVAGGQYEVLGVL
jgi:hypothetical protein